MATVLTVEGVRFVIYPNDHRPAHVHLIGAGVEAVFHLRCPKGPPELRENYGFQRSDLQRMKGLLKDNLALLCFRWKGIHGDF